MKRSTLLVPLLLALALSSTARAEVIARLAIEAGDADRADAPASLTLPTTVLPGPVRLVEIRDAQRVDVPVQRDGARFWWIASGTMPAGSKRHYELVTADAPAPATAPSLQVKKEGTGLVVMSGDAKVLQYNDAVVPPPAKADPKYARSGFVHPLYTPAGKVLTRIHAPDHIHHMGLWNAWTDVEFEGRQVDFWNIRDGKGLVRFVKWNSQDGGPVFADLSAEQEQVDLKAPGGEKVALKETVGYRVWNVGGPKAGYWLVDVTLTDRCASQSPVKLVKYRYGGLGFRATADWKMDNSDYLTSEGKDRKTGHGTRGRWCEMFGQCKDGPAGILFMSHPENHEHPEPMRIWPVEGDIFFNFCPIQQADWTLEPGKDYTLRYRIMVFDGKITKDDAERQWQNFAHPLVATIDK